MEKARGAMLAVRTERIAVRVRKDIMILFGLGGFCNVRCNWDLKSDLELSIERVDESLNVVERTLELLMGVMSWLWRSEGLVQCSSGKSK